MTTSRTLVSDRPSAILLGEDGVRIEIGLIVSTIHLVGSHGRSVRQESGLELFLTLPESSGHHHPGTGLSHPLSAEDVVVFGDVAVSLVASELDSRRVGLSDRALQRGGSRAVLVSLDGMRLEITCGMSGDSERDSWGTGLYVQVGRGENYYRVRTHHALDVANFARAASALASAHLRTSAAPLTRRG
jgi:hypothetical protein